MSRSLFFFTLFSFLSFISLSGAIGCMDNSRHGYLCNDGARVCRKARHDTKRLHYVPCSCPCDQYPRMEKKGQCPACLHFRKGESWEYIR